MRRLAFLIVLLWAVSASAFTIPTTTYNGHVYENGQPVNGTRYFSFTFFGQETGGVPLLPAFADSALVVNGVVQKHIPIPLVLWTGAERWLEVAINGEPPLTPRQKIGTVPYAAMAMVADSVRIRPRVVSNYATYSNVVPDNNWVIVGNLFFTTSTPGVADVTFNGFLRDADTGNTYKGELSIGVVGMAGTDPVLRFYTFGNTGPLMETPFSLSKAVPYSAGSTTIYLYARNTDSFFGSLTVFVVGATATLVP